MASPASPQRRRKQEVAQARASARWPRASHPSGERVVVTGTASGPGQLCLVGLQVRPVSLFLFLFFFFCFVFFVLI